MPNQPPSLRVPDPPPIQTIRREFRDFDELAETVRGWGLDWVQLDRGPLVAGIHQISTLTAQFGRFHFSRRFHQRGTTPPGVRTFGLIGKRSPDVERQGKVATNAHILAFPADAEFDMVSQPGFHGSTVSIPEDLIRTVADFLGLPDPLEGVPDGLTFVETDPRRQSALRTAISRLYSTVIAHSDGLQHAADFSEMEFDVVGALVKGVQSSEPADATIPEPILRARAIRRSLDYIEEHADEAPTVREMCRASGASWRTLDYAFRDRFGVTPKQYLQAARLQRVRHAILKAESETSILEIAARWGFWHMGQFAKVYRRQFGELPSETIRRSGGAKKRDASRHPLKTPPTGCGSGT